MSITPDGWFSFAQREPGPADKVYSQQNSAEWFIAHSAVGYYGGWTNRLFAKDRGPDGRYTAYAAASIHGWNAYDGTFIQHYPITASCWGSGSFTPNTRAIAIENEGGAPGNEFEPLTGPQKLTIVRILEDLAEWRGVGVDYWKRPTSAQDATATLYEHRECVRFGSLPTACPSNRIPWDSILELLQEDDVEMNIADLEADMLQEELRREVIRTLMRSDYQFALRDNDPKTGEPIIEVLSGKGTDEAIRIRVR